MRTIVHSTLLMAALVAAINCVAQEPFELDPTFQTAIRSSYVNSIAMMAEDQLLVSGRINFTTDPFSNNIGSARLYLDGSRDVDFPTFPLTNGGGKITAWNDGYYIAAGQTVRRLQPNGYLDTDFIEMNLGPYFSSLQGGDYHVFDDGRVLVTGTHTLNDPVRGFVGNYNLIWFSNTGYLDTTRTHRKSNSNMFEFEVMPDGSMICSTQGTTYENQPVSRVFRTDQDGVLDPAFNAPLDNYGWTWAIKATTEDKILLGGAYRLPGEPDTLSLLRLLPNGALDPLFHRAIFRSTTTVNIQPQVLDILELENGELIVTGNFDTVDGHERGGIAMMHADGTVNTAYFIDAACGVSTTAGITYRRISGIVPAPDGSYYIYGAYRGYNDGTTNHPQQAFVSRLYGLNVGVEEGATLPPLAVFPNPSAGTFSLELPLQAPATLQLLDASGRVVHVQQLGAGPYSHTIRTTAKPGAYVLRVQQGNGQVRRGRVVVE